MAEGGVGAGILPPLLEQPEEEGVQQPAGDQQGVQQHEHVDGQAEGIQPGVQQPGEGHQEHQVDVGQPAGEHQEPPVVDQPAPVSEGTSGVGAAGGDQTDAPGTENNVTTEDD